MAIKKVRYLGEYDEELLTPGKEYEVFTEYMGGFWVTGDNGCNAFADEEDVEILEEDDGDYEFQFSDPTDDDEETKEETGNDESVA